MWSTYLSHISGRKAVWQFLMELNVHLLEKSRVYSMGPGVGKRSSGLEHREPEKKLLISELRLVIGEN